MLAALGPKMLALAAEMTDGAHPYCVTPEHTAEARRILGPGKLLCPEVMVLLETDPAKARAAARTALATYIQLENYANNWRRLGFTDDDLAGGGSDRFVDANIAWGDEGAIRKRLQLYWDAGADHVCIQSIHPSGSRTRSTSASSICWRPHRSDCRCLIATRTADGPGNSCHASTHINEASTHDAAYISPLPLTGRGQGWGKDASGVAARVFHPTPNPSPQGEGSTRRAAS